MDVADRAPRRPSSRIRPLAAPSSQVHISRLAQLVLAVSSDAVFALDRDGRVTFVNDAAEVLLRRPRTGLLGTEVWATFPDLVGSGFDRAFRAAVGDGEPRTVEGWFAPLASWYEVRVFPYDDGAVAFCRDVGERHRQDAARAEVARSTMSILDALPLPTVLVGPDGAIRRANHAWDAMAGRGRPGLDDATGGNYLSICARAADRGESGSAHLLAQLRRLIAGEVDAVRRDQRWEHTDGVRWTHIQASRVDGSQDIVVVHHDVTERVATATAEAQRARRDELTGLPNRVRLLEVLRDRLLTREQRPFAILFLDLDGFKTVNDSLGHDVGDLLIRDVATRLGATTSPGELLARLGGDEFVVVVDEADADPRADGLRAALRDPFDVGGMRLPLSVSVGIARCEADHERPQDLLRDADTAMYAAKAAGRDRSHRFTADLRQSARDRLEVVEGLARALRTDGLELHYQPIIDLATGVVDGAEALMRWRHPRRGLLPPATFIPAAEETGLIVEMSRWALLEAARQAEAWRATGMRIGVGVNISAEHFTAGTLVEDVAAALEATGLRPRALVLELTETSIARSYREAVAQLQELRAIGVQIAIDDFGTGYSSLARLASVPVDYIKFDAGLLRTATDARDAHVLREIVAAVVGVADAIGVEALAEGIETEAQRAEAVELGCQRAQGYLISRPVAAPELMALFADGTLVAETRRDRRP
jgi:diguanylate cyclase (GGDEF)-like protein